MIAPASRLALWSLLILLLATTADPAQAGEVRGWVDSPEEPRLRRQSRQYATPTHFEAGPRPEPRAAVYLENELTRAMPLRPDARGELQQKGLQFIPSILPIQVGGSVSFPNLDSTFHNVFSYSPPKTFDLGRYKKGEAPPVETFDTPGVVQVFCEVHEHMRATILVLETPFYTTTGTDGSFSIANVPRGIYRLVVWYNPRDQRTVEIEVKSDEPLVLDLRQSPP